MAALSSTSTHVVIGIEWGGKATITVKYTNKQKKDNFEVEGQTSAELNRLRDIVKNLGITTRENSNADRSLESTKDPNTGEKVDSSKYTTSSNAVTAPTNATVNNTVIDTIQSSGATVLPAKITEALGDSSEKHKFELMSGVGFKAKLEIAKEKEKQSKISLITPCMLMQTLTRQKTCQRPWMVSKSL